MSLFAGVLAIQPVSASHSLQREDQRSDLAEAQAKLDTWLADIAAAGRAGPSSLAAAEAAEPTGVVVTAEATSPLAAGGGATIDLSVFNNADTDLNAPVTLSVSNLPAGVSLAGVDSDLSGHEWDCATETAVCTLVRSNDGTTPAALDAFDIAAGTIRLSVDATAVIEATVDVVVSASGRSTPDPDLTNATSIVTMARLADGAELAVSVSATNAGMIAGQPSTTTLDIVNLGPAALGGPGAGIVVTGVIPTGATGWEISGIGWTCVDEVGRPVCSWTGAARGAGTAVDPLVVTFVSPTQATADGEPLLFDTTVTYRSAAGIEAVVVADRIAAVLAGRAPTAEVFANVDGLAAVEQGGRLPIEIGMSGGGLDDDSRTVAVTTVLPRGWSLESVDGSAWACAADGSALRCERSADFDGESSSSVAIELGVSGDAVVGPQQLVLIGSVSGADAGADTRTELTVDVGENLDIARSDLRIFHYDSNDEAQLIVDGSALAVTKTQPALLGLDLINTGTVTIEAGSTLTLTVEVPRGARVRSKRDNGGPRWWCVTRRQTDSSVATCRLVLGDDVAPGSAVPRAKLLFVVPSQRDAGLARWPVSFTAVKAGASIDSLATEISVPVNVIDFDEPVPVVSLATELVLAPRIGGRTGVVTATITNVGEAFMRRWWFSVDSPVRLTPQQRALLPDSCKDTRVRSTTDPAVWTSRVWCVSSSGLEVGATGPTLALPVAVVEGVDRYELPIRGRASDAEAFSTTVSVAVLPALHAVATATPDRVSIPVDDARPRPVVLLDGLASEAAGATATWSQDLSIGGPAVVFDDVTPTETVTGLRASFVAPSVDRSTILRFVLTLDDGSTSDTAVVDVIVDPAGVQPAVSRSDAVAPGIEVNSGRATPKAGAIGRVDAINVGSGSWSWSTDPTFSLSDVFAASLVVGSRVRQLDDGVFAWDGPGAEPVDTTVSTQWQRCDEVEPTACTDEAVGDAYLVDFDDGIVQAVVTIAGTDEVGDPVSTTETFTFGAPAIRFGAPTNIVAPSISGVPTVGSTLTGSTGEWSFEYAKDIAWLRCAGPDTTIDCAVIDGTSQFGNAQVNGTVVSDYIVQPEDEGFDLRFQVIAWGREFSGSSLLNTSPVTVGGDPVACDTDCWVWTVLPTIDRDGAGGPQPTTLRTATLVDNGTFAWADPSPAPETPTVSNEWFNCFVVEPTVCSLVGTGPTHVPELNTRFAETLEARLTVSGSAVDGTTRSTTLVVPFGEIADGGLPIATTPPSISGTSNVGNLLLADPGVWDFATSTDRSYEWLRCVGTDPDTCVSTGITTPTFAVNSDNLTEFASVIRVEVTAEGLAGTTTVRSDPTDPVSGDEKELIRAPRLEPVPAPKIGVPISITPAVWSELPTSVPGSEGVTWDTCVDATTCSGSFTLGAGQDFLIPDGNAGRWLRARSSIEFIRPNGVVSSAQANTFPVGPIVGADIVLTTDLGSDTVAISNGETLTVEGFASGGAPPISLGWGQVSGPAGIVSEQGGQIVIQAPFTGSGTMVFNLGAIDSQNSTASLRITVDYGNADVSPELCDAAQALEESAFGPRTLDYGRIAITFQGGTNSNGRCDEDTVLTLDNVEVDAFDLIALSRVTTTISDGGVTFTGSDLGQIALGTGTSLDTVDLGIEVGAELSVAFDGDGYEIVGVITGNVPKMAVPDTGAWVGASRLELSSVGGEQTLSLDAIGWEGGTGVPTPVDGDLPIPPAGAPTVSLAGSLSTDKTFALSLSTTDFLTFGGVGVDFSGSVSRPDPATDLDVAVSASLSDAVTLSTGVVLESATIVWNNSGDGSTSFGGEGAVTITTNGRAIDIVAGFSFVDPSRWRADLSVGATGTWTPVDGFNLENPVVSGRISRSVNPDPTTVFAIDISADAIAVGSDFVLNRPSLALEGTCAAGDCDLDLEFGTRAQVTIFESVALDAIFQGTLATASGDFAATGSINFDSVGVFAGIRLGNVELSIDRVDGGIDYGLSATARVFDIATSVTVSYGDDGALMIIDVGDWLPFEGASELTEVRLVLSTYETQVTFGVAPDAVIVDIPADSLTVSAVSGLPDWLTDRTGPVDNSASVFGQISVSPLIFDFQLEFVFDDLEVFDVEGVRLGISSITLGVVATENTFTAGIEGAGTLTMPGVNGAAPSTFGIEAGLFFASGSVGGWVRLGGVGGPAWNNAFGVDGLTIEELLVSVSLQPGAGPALGFSGTVILPPNWEDQIGLASGTSITLTAAISAGFGCFGIEIGEPDSETDVIDIANLGAVTATYASLYIAPVGCQVGDITIEPGIALAFDGAVFDVTVEANLTIAPVPGGVSVDAALDVGQVRIAELDVRSMSLRVNISPTDRAIAFAAEATIFDVDVAVAGSFSTVLGVSKVDFEGSLTTPDFGGFEIEELLVAFSYTSAPIQELTVSAALDINILGQPQSAAFEFELLNGSVVEISGEITVNIVVDELAITGTGSFEAARGEFPTIDIAGSASVDGRDLTAVSASLREGYLQFSAAIVGGGIFDSSPQVAGEVFWKSTPDSELPQIRNVDGDLVDAVDGDFRFEATNIGISIDSFRVGGDIVIGRAGGVFFADVFAEFELALSRSSQVDISFRGQLSGAGNITLTGSGAVTIGGLSGVEMDFLISRQGADVTLAGSAAMTIPRLGVVEVAGSFQNVSGRGWFYEVTGSLVISTDGYDFGSADFTAYRTNSSGGSITGMRANFAVDIPDLVAGDVTASISSNGYVYFFAGLATQGKLGDALGGPTATLRFFNSSAGVDYSFRVSVRDVMKIPGSYTISGNVESNGAFDLSANVALGPWSQEHTFVCEAYFTASGVLDVRIASDPAAGEFSIGATIDADVSAGCGSFGLSVGASADFSYRAPAEFALTIKLRIEIATVATWRPTLYSA